jgi:hypothetical protein
MSEYINSDNDESSNGNRHRWSIPSKSYSSHVTTSRNSSYGHSAAPIIISDSEDDIKKEDDVSLSSLSGEYLIVFSHTKVQIKYYWQNFVRPLQNPAWNLLFQRQKKNLLVNSTRHKLQDQYD